MKVLELTPGDQIIVPFGEATATFVQQAEHPIWPHLRLVIWRMSDGSWSHDALDARQDVGDPVHLFPSPGTREKNLRTALLNEGVKP